MALRKAFAEAHYQLPDDIAPADALIEMRMNMVEESHYKAETLGEVTAKEDEDGLCAKEIDVDRNGGFRLKKINKSRPQPSGVEDLRKRLRTWSASWMYASLKVPSNDQLAGMTPQLFYDYVEYLLGADVYGLSAHDPSGALVTRPPFSLLLEYEHYVRRLLAKLLNEGVRFVDALPRAYMDADTRQRRFLTPMQLGALAAATRNRSRSPRRAQQPQRQ